MNDVTIPADVAKRMADWLRDAPFTPSGYPREWLDLLDPQPPTLHERVRVAFYVTGYGSEDEQVDAVLEVVADWLAAQPVHDGTATGLWALEPRLAQRDADVALIRGGGAS